MTDYSDALHNSFLVTDHALAEFQYEGATATAVILWKHGDDRYLQAANVGDSAAYLWYSSQLFASSIINANPWFLLLSRSLSLKPRR